MKIINQKPLSEIKDEKERQKIESQGDALLAIGALYEEMETLKARVAALEGGAK